MSKVEQKIRELSKKAPWNHNFNINGIMTIKDQKYSIGNNKIKWDALGRKKVRTKRKVRTRWLRRQSNPRRITPVLITITTSQRRNTDTDTLVFR